MLPAAWACIACRILLPDELSCMEHQRLPAHVDVCCARIATRIGASESELGRS